MNHTFTAIDFETANADRTSVCAVGIIVIEKGSIAFRHMQLIRPEPCWFDPFNVAIHGIRSSDVTHAPTFEEYWPTLQSLIRGPMVAHNAAFDMSVLRASLDRARQPYPETDYFCTRVISRIVWPQCPSYALNHLAQLLDIELNHHHAEDDAKACALVALRACESRSLTSLYDFSEACGLRIGKLHPGGYSPCGGPRKTRPRAARQTM